MIYDSYNGSYEYKNTIDNGLYIYMTHMIYDM
jgi:hypothetical protein